MKIVGSGFSHPQVLLVSRVVGGCSALEWQADQGDRTSILQSHKMFVSWWLPGSYFRLSFYTAFAACSIFGWAAVYRVGSFPQCLHCGLPLPFTCVWRDLFVFVVHTSSTTSTLGDASKAGFLASLQLLLLLFHSSFLTSALLGLL